MPPGYGPSPTPEQSPIVFSTLMRRLDAVRDAIESTDLPASIAPPRTPRDRVCLALLAATTAILQLRGEGARRSLEDYG